MRVAYIESLWCRGRTCREIAFAAAGNADCGLIRARDDASIWPTPPIMEALSFLLCAFVALRFAAELGVGERNRYRPVMAVAKFN